MGTAHNRSSIKCCYNKLAIMPKSTLATSTIKGRKLIDRSSYEVVSTLATEGGTYTAPYNGWLTVECVKDDGSGVSEYILTVGGKTIVRYRVASSDYFSFCVPLQKGDVVTVRTLLNMYDLANRTYFYRA